MSVCCLSARISHKRHVQTSRNFLYGMLSVADDWSSCDDNAVCYILFVDDVTLHISLLEQVRTQDTVVARWRRGAKSAIIDFIAAITSYSHICQRFYFHRILPTKHCQYRNSIYWIRIELSLHLRVGKPACFGVLKRIGLGLAIAKVMSLSPHSEFFVVSVNR